AIKEQLYQRITNELSNETRIIPFYRRPVFRAAAAAVLLIAAAATIFLLSRGREPQPLTGTAPQIRLMPGGNKAVLTLADGSLIVLDSAANGSLAQQGNMKVLKLDNGQLAYRSGDESAGEVLYNTITTPRGGQYQVVLADGSRVWLNAASSLRFPASFTGRERRVELTGEGYFEITKNPSMPFKVNMAGKGEVEVLGTHFNINAYDDESHSRITLLEGSVKVSRGAATSILKPGQQAQLADGIKVAQDADLEEVMAWKNGKFIFNKTDVQATMRQLARWYDASVSYQGKVDGFFNGTISRSAGIEKVLKMLQLTDEVQFSIEGKTIVVKP
ncbi:MAG: FecR domain-containing protein, partial [Chitinophagaceae bacterium]